MRALLLFSLCLLFVGCADVEMKPGSKPMARRDIPPGPGFLTGPSGEFVIFRLNGDQQDEPEGPEPGPHQE